MNKFDNSDLIDVSNTVSVDALLQAAVDFHNSGNLVEAEAHYRKILEDDPKNPNVFFGPIPKRPERPG